MGREHGVESRREDNCGVKVGSVFGIRSVQRGVNCSLHRVGGRMLQLALFTQCSGATGISGNL